MVHGVSSVIPPVWRTSTLESFFKLLTYFGLNNGKKKAWPEFLRKYYFKLYSRRHSLCLFFSRKESWFLSIFSSSITEAVSITVSGTKSQLCYFINCTKELLHDRHLHHLYYLFCLGVFDEHRRWISGSLQVTCGHWMLLLVSASTEKEPFPEPCSSSLSCCWTRSKRFLFFSSYFYHYPEPKVRRFYSVFLANPCSVIPRGTLLPS